MNYPTQTAKLSKPGITKTRRIVFAGLGWCSVALGLAGVFLPGLPTTVFVIAASYLFARSSPRFEGWLRTNRYFGPRLQRYHEHDGGMPKTAKIAALTSMWTAITISSFALAAISYALPAITIGLGLVGTTTILFFVRTVTPLRPVTPALGGPPRTQEIADGAFRRSVTRPAHG